ncbi:MAG: glutamate--tRNA ligase [Verrucomicrobiales bacterium]
MIRTRFAPSPTGYLHVGGARTALFNWLYARHHGGRFILRIEDTDAARNTPEALAAIYDGLRWLGLDWDEGPDAGGSFGPYRQSERGAIYDHWFGKLEEIGRVYDDNGAWRFRFERKPITVPDLVAGDVTVDYTDASNTPDMVIRRSDGSYVFHFVNVVDDLEMGITHVIRGDDHLPNTPKHLQLFEALGVEPPVYGHIPLILNANGSKMSKRDEGASVRQYDEEGFLAPAVVNFLALLGWSPKDDSEILPREELIRRFEISGVNRKSAVFDLEKCRWFSGQYLHEADARSLLSASAKWFQSADLADLPDEAKTTILDLVKVKIRTLGELPPWLDFFRPGIPALDAEAEAKLAGDPRREEIKSALCSALTGIPAESWSSDALKDAVATAAEALCLKSGKLMLPLRVLATGKVSGPDLMPFLAWLGREATLERLQK